MVTRRAAREPEGIRTLAEINAGGMSVHDAMPAGGEVVEYEPHDPTQEEEEPPQSPADRVMAMIAEHDINDARAYVRVSRQEEGNRTSWCKDYSISDFERGGYEMVRRHWGGGEYQIIVYGTVPGTKRFTIRTRAQVQLNEPLTPIDGNPAQSPTSDLSAILTAMQESNRAMLEAIQASKPAPVDSMAQMSGMLAMMKAMREAMGLDAAPKGGNQLKEIIEGVRAIQEVKDMVSPPDTPETPMGMVTQMLPLLQTAMAQRNQQSAQQPARAPQIPMKFPTVDLPPGAQTIVPAPTPPENETVNPIAILALKAHLATLLQMGKEGKPAQDGADLLYEHLPDDFFTILAQPNWLELLKMVTDANTVDGIKDWLLMARNRMLWMLQNPEAMERDETMPDGWSPEVPAIVS